MLARILSTRPTLDPYGGFGTAEEQQKDAVDRALEADAPFESASVIGNVRMDATIFCLTGRGWSLSTAAQKDAAVIAACRLVVLMAPDMSAGHGAEHARFFCSIRSCETALDFLPFLTGVCLPFL